VPDDDLDAARRASDMARRASDAARDAMAAATGEHRAFEAALKARRKVGGRRLLLGWGCFQPLRRSEG
jgi:hypothetical protein